MLILLVPFHLRFCALFNGFSTEPFPPPPSCSNSSSQAITPLLDYLTNNLRTLGDYLLTEVLCG